MNEYCSFLLFSFNGNCSAWICIDVVSIGIDLDMVYANDCCGSVPRTIKCYGSCNKPVLYTIAYSVALFFPAMGEELGWRGYMTRVMCIGMGAILSYFTKKTKSIYPASFLHMINNNVINLLYVPFVKNEVVEQHAFVFSILTLAPILVLGIVMGIFYMRDGEKKTIAL